MPLYTKDLIVDTLSAKQTCKNTSTTASLLTSNKRQKFDSDAIIDETNVSITFDGKDSNSSEGDSTNTDANLFQFDFGKNKSQGDILSSLIGSNITVHTKIDKDKNDENFDREDESVTGVLLSVEKEDVPIGDTTSSSAPIRTVNKWTNLLILTESDSQLVTIKMDDLLKFKINNQYIQEQLQKSIMKSLDNRKPKEKLTGKTRIRISGNKKSKRKQNNEMEEEEKNKQMKISYVSNAKEWRCSYRMNIPKEKSSSSSDEFNRMNIVDAGDLSETASPTSSTAASTTSSRFR